jgi:hypothetical protein
MTTDRQKLIKLIQPFWKEWVRRINSEEEQFEEEAEKRRKLGKAYELQYSLEQKEMKRAYSRRRVLAREVYTTELSLIKRAINWEELSHLSVPIHIPKIKSQPKYF